MIRETDSMEVSPFQRECLVCARIDWLLGRVPRSTRLDRPWWLAQLEGATIGFRRPGQCARIARIVAALGRHPKPRSLEFIRSLRLAVRRDD